MHICTVNIDFFLFSNFMILIIWMASNCVRFEKRILDFSITSKLIRCTLGEKMFRAVLYNVNIFWISVMMLIVTNFNWNSKKKLKKKPEKYKQLILSSLQWAKLLMKVYAMNNVTEPMKIVLKLKVQRKEWKHGYEAFYLKIF